MNEINEISIRVGDIVNGKKIIKIKDDPFAKNRVNLWTDDIRFNCFGEEQRVSIKVEKANVSL